MGEPIVTLRDSPSEEIVKAASEVEYIVAGDLKIGVKKPGILQQYRIVEIVGDSAKNEVYMGMINPVLWVVEIDGDRISALQTKRELEALIQRLGEDGVVAIAKHLAAKVETSGSVDSLKN